MSDSTIGTADVKLDALSSGGQLEEWVPLRLPEEKGGITWYVQLCHLQGTIILNTYVITNPGRLSRSKHNTGLQGSDSLFDLN